MEKIGELRSERHPAALTALCAPSPEGARWSCAQRWKPRSREVSSMSECATDRTNRADVPPGRQVPARAPTGACRRQTPAIDCRWGAQTRLAATGKALILAAGLCLPAARLAAQPAAEPAPPPDPSTIPEPQPVVGSPPA